MAERTGTCIRCSATFTQSGRGRPATACPACRNGKLCSQEGCGRSHKTAGLCGPHYERWRRGADLSTPVRQYERGERICKVDGCERERDGSATYCGMHQNRVYWRGEPGPAEPKIAARGHAIWNTPNHRRGVSNLWKFGLTSETFDELLAAQGGRCAVCGTDDPKGNRVSTWTVDHDHTCCPGKRSCGRCVRGLLCNRCNRAVGLLGDDPAALAAAAAYLRRHQQARASLDA